MLVRMKEPEDAIEIAEWMRKRGHEDWDADKVRDYFPTLGVIVPNLASLSWYLTDDMVAIFEGMVTNPDAPSEARREAGMLCVDTFRNIFHTVKYKRWLAYECYEELRPYLEHLGGALVHERMRLWVGGGK